MQALLGSRTASDTNPLAQLLLLVGLYYGFALARRKEYARHAGALDGGGRDGFGHLRCRLHLASAGGQPLASCLLAGRGTPRRAQDTACRVPAPTVTLGDFCNHPLARPRRQAAGEANPAHLTGIVAHEVGQEWRAVEVEESAIRGYQR